MAPDSEVPVPKKAKAFEKTRAATPMFGKGNEPRYSVAGKTHPFARFNEKRTSHARLLEVILGGSWIGIFYWICAYRPKIKSLSRIAGKVST